MVGRCVDWVDVKIVEDLAVVSEFGAILLLLRVLELVLFNVLLKEINLLVEFELLFGEYLFLKLERLTSPFIIFVGSRIQLSLARCASSWSFLGSSFVFLPNVVLLDLLEL